jgi:ATP-dependent 26S proteasome regulatory subunit
VLDPAIVRDGRIDRKVTVTRPCIKSAEEILRLNLNRIPMQKGLDVNEMANQSVQLIYSNDCRVRKDMYLRDIVSGAMLANCINIAISHAIQRDLLNGRVKTGSGLQMPDLRAAVDRILQQSQTILHEFGA